LVFTVEDDRTGLLAPIGDGPAHGRAILDLLDDETKRLSFGRAAHRSARRFSWSEVASSILHVYERLAGGHRANLCCDDEIFASAM
jgi:glycosyltransferase involved in cell wall biosynthesis